MCEIERGEPRCIVDRTQIRATYEQVNALTEPISIVSSSCLEMLSSWASTLDYATIATTLFAETIVGGSTRIRGSHVKELRNAIDAVRNSAGLPPYAPASGEGWTGWPASYSPASGRILAVHVGAMRRALEEAVSQLNGSHLAAVANPSGKILAVHFNDLREAVR
jgi:hypothetical protein